MPRSQLQDVMAEKSRHVFLPHSVCPLLTGALLHIIATLVCRLTRMCCLEGGWFPWQGVTANPTSVLKASAQKRHTLLLLTLLGSKPAAWPHSTPRRWECSLPLEWGLSDALHSWPLWHSSLMLGTMEDLLLNCLDLVTFCETCLCLPFQ